MTDFVFATAQYDSGDWDSAPLVPANIIDTIARYTEIQVAPSGVIVPLASPSLFRYPLIYMTGHLPVRFSSAERTNLQRYAERGADVIRLISARKASKYEAKQYNEQIRN